MVANIDNGFVIERIKAITNTDPQLDEKYDLSVIVPSERLQVRIDRNNAPAEMVKRFTHQMASSVFPPIVVTLDGKIIDGNTRYRARLNRNEVMSSVLIVPISWDDADAETRERLLLLGLALNNVNGKPLDEEERAEMIRHAINIGLSDTQIQYQVGVADKVVRALRAELDAKHRMTEAGVETEMDGADIKIGDRKLAPAVVRALGTSGTTSLDDDSYRELATLAADANFRANEIKSLAAGLRGLTSAEMRQDKLERERAAAAQRIAEVRAGSVGQPPYARQLRGKLALITESEHPADAFVERNIEDMIEHVRVLQIAATTINRVLELQAALMPTVGAAE